GIRDGHVTGVQTCALPISDMKVSPRRVVRRCDRAIALRWQSGCKRDCGSWAASSRRFALPYEALRVCRDFLLLATNHCNARVHRSEERRVGKELRYASPAE